MKSLKGKYLKLMQEKLDAMNNMLEIAQSQVFTGKEELAETEARAFADYYRMRMDYFARIKKAEDAMSVLDPLGEQDIADETFSVRVVGYREKMVAIARKMADLDSANADAYRKISVYLRKDEDNE